MKISTLLFFLLCYFIFVSFTEAQKKAALPSGWKLFNECTVKLYLPPEFKEEFVIATDSCLKQYRSADAQIIIDVLGYITPNASTRDDYSDEQDFRYIKTKIRKRPAEIITFYNTENNQSKQDLNYVAILFVPQMRKGRGGNLQIAISAKDAEKRTALEKVFKTVRFPKK